MKSENDENTKQTQSSEIDYNLIYQLLEKANQQIINLQRRISAIEYLPAFTIWGDHRCIVSRVGMKINSLFELVYSTNGRIYKENQPINVSLHATQKYGILIDLPSREATGFISSVTFTPSPNTSFHVLALKPECKLFTDYLDFLIFTTHIVQHALLTTSEPLTTISSILDVMLNVPIKREYDVKFDSQSA